MTQDEERLLYAAYYNDLKNVKILDALGVNMGAMDSERRTALMIASSEGHIDIV
jgi:ankyrin repeat protein